MGEPLAVHRLRAFGKITPDHGCRRKVMQSPAKRIDHQPAVKAYLRIAPKVPAKGDAAILHIETEDGLVGWGEGKTLLAVPDSMVRWCIC